MVIIWRGLGFLVLVVVIAIMLIMTGMVVGVYTTSMNSDRIRSGARQVQSSMMGAHDRAIHAHAPRGIRLQLANPYHLGDFLRIKS